VLRNVRDDGPMHFGMRVADLIVSQPAASPMISIQWSAAVFGAIKLASEASA
jgi:hypothetical protein